MEEEAKLDILLRLPNLFAQHSWQKHQMVVMDPDHVIVIDICCNCFRKKAVRFSVRVPGGLVEGDFTRMVMEERPKNGVCN